MTWGDRAGPLRRSGQPNGTRSRRPGDERFPEPAGFRLVSLSRRHGAGRRQHPAFRRASVYLPRASSQFPPRQHKIPGPTLFPMGLLILLVGSLVGLLTPVTVIDRPGIGPSFQQAAA